MIALSAALSDAAARLAEAGIPDARHEARLLLGAATSLSKTAMIAEPRRSVAESEANCLAAMLMRRAEREPLSRILGWREFWSLRFALGPDTLDPRPDSETLIAAALEWTAAGDGKARPWRVLDLGTGSGCLLLALLSELPQARGVGVDLSAGALATAAGNAEALGLGQRARFAWDDWGHNLGERFEIILCNPPYIPAEEIAGLEPEVARFEPRLALSGGRDGLACYRRLAEELPALISPVGRAFIEIGAGQADAVEGIMVGAGLAAIGRRSDLAGRPRCLIFGSPENPQKTIGKAMAND